nr:Ig-like domain-containing protein [Lachnospiraceae bacterium]
VSKVPTYAPAGFSFNGWYYTEGGVNKDFGKDMAIMSNMDIYPDVTEIKDTDEPTPVPDNPEEPQDPDTPSEPTPVPENPDEPKEPESPLGPTEADQSQYTADKSTIAVKSINLKKTLFADVEGAKTFKVVDGDVTAAKIKGSTLTVLKDGVVTVEAYDNNGTPLAKKDVSMIVPKNNTASNTEINRRGNIDLNKYIISSVKPSKWKSLNKKVADVDANGLLKIKKSGTVKISVTFPAEKGMKAKTLTIKLKIKMPQFKKSTYTVKVGKTVNTAVKNADTDDITYRTENEAIATVDKQGVVTGVSKGATKLIMTVKGIDYETKIKVK